jgi:hypothetical protein
VGHFSNSSGGEPGDSEITLSIDLSRRAWGYQGIRRVADIEIVDGEISPMYSY